MRATLLVFVGFLLLLAIARPVWADETWRVYPANPVLAPSQGQWDSMQVNDPCVIRDGAVYRMYYTGHDNNNVTRIGLATSPDGISWNKHPANPVLPANPWDNTGVQSPAVVKVGDVYHMWFLNHAESLVGYASSPDGVTWTSHPDPVMAPGSSEWEGWYIQGIHVVSETNGFLMAYGSRNIGVAFSADGLGWTKYPGNPVIERVGNDWGGGNYLSQPAMLNRGRSYSIWYVANGQIGWATSYNGYEWVKQDRIGALPFGVNMPSVLEENGVLHMWYSHLGFSIHYASTSVGLPATPTATNVAATPTVTRTRTPTATATPTVGPGTPVPVGPWRSYAGNPVIPNLQPGWSYGAGQPAVIRDDDLYRMYYAGSSGTGQYPGYHIGMATSADGLTWTRLAAPVLSPDQGWEYSNMLEPAVVKRNGVYHLWFTGGRQNMYSSIGYATSTDGVSWTKHPVPVLTYDPGSWEAVGVFSPSVIADADGFRMYYAAADGSASSIGMATSPDGIYWTKHPANPLIRYSQNPWSAYPAHDPYVVVLDGVYHMWFTGSYAIHHATSSDGIVWSPAPVTPALSGEYYSPSLLNVAGLWHMWMGAPNGVHYATTGFPPVPSATPTATHTATSTPSRTPTATRTPRFSLYLPLIVKSVPRPTNTPTSTLTPTPTATPTPGWAVILRDGFEDAFPGPRIVFDANGPEYGEFHWGKSACDKYAGSFSAWAIGGGANGAQMQCGGSYSKFTNSWMVYGPISLAQAYQAQLRFKAKINSETGYDGLCYAASVDAAHFYGSCLSGSTGWGERVFDLTKVPTLGNLAGRPLVWLAFIFSSDSLGEYANGAFVDDVAVHICSGTYAGACPGFAPPAGDALTLPTRIVELALPTSVDMPAP